jgi:3-deoxy-manno-octulosonate cytidylyltransferase (CMP-KDO synthetase)
MQLDADIVVATDDERIRDVVAGFGGACVMTSPDARNGTERCAEVAANFAEKAKFIINLQGDSPMVERSHLAALISHWQNTGADMATPYLVCDDAASVRLKQDIKAGRAGGVVAGIDARGQASYFTRDIPDDHGQLHLHVGLYGYTPFALRQYQSLPPSAAELCHGLEQLRFLDNGFPIDMVPVMPPRAGYADVNYPHDVAVVERMLQGEIA